MKFVTVFVLCAIFIASASAAPEPEATRAEAEPEPACQLKARSKSECRKLSRRKDACTTCVTSKCGACRTIYERWCRNPEPVADVETCLKQRADTAKARGKRSSVVRAFCRKALRKQCEEHACGGEPEPEPVPEPGACQLKARSKSECRKLSRKKDACSTCVTSKCGACRTIFERWCRNPEPVPDVETCLKARADTARARGKRDSVVRAFCRKALRKQCQEHSCAGGAPPKVPQPPKVTQEGPCIPRTKRALKIKGSGKQCKKAHKLKKQVKELKKKLNCLLVAFEGNIPKIKTEVLPPKPKIIRKVVKEVIPGEWVQKPAKIVEKVVTQIVQPTRRETARPRTTKKKAKVTKKPTPRPNTRKVVRRRRRPTPRPNNRKVRRRRRRRRRRRPNTRKVVRRRRRRPANNGRKVRRRRRRRRRRRPTNSRKVVRRRRRRRRRGGRAVRRRRRGGRAVRRRRRGGRAVRRRRVVVRRRRPAANTRVRRRPVRKAAPAPVRNSRV